MRPGGWRAAAAIGALCLVTSAAAAEPAGAPGRTAWQRPDEDTSRSGARLPYAQLPDEGSPVDDLIPPVRPERFTLSLQGGIFNPSGDAIQEVYPGRMLSLGLTAGYFVRPGLAVSVGGAFSSQTGLALGRSSSRPSDDEVKIRITPIEVGALYRLTWLPVPFLTPFLGAGLTCHLFHEEGLDASVSGGRWGAYGRVGLGYRIETGGTRPWTSDANRGIRGTLLTLEAGYSLASGIGEGLDLGGLTVRGGITLDF